MPSIPTYDFETEADSLKRKQAIADAMQAGALQPLQLPSQPGVKLSGVNVLAKLLEGYVGGKKAEAVNQERTALSQRYGDELRSGMEQFYKTSQGYSEPSLALAPNADGSPQTVTVPGDRKKAIFDALASNHPALRELAMTQLKEEGKNQLTPKDLLGIATPESVLANTANPTAWKPKRELKAYSPGEVLLDSSGNYATPGNPSGKAPYDLQNIGGDLYQRSATGLKKLDNAPKVNVNASPVIMGQKAGMEAWSKAAAGTVTDLAESARNSTKLLSQLNQMEALTRGGTAAGPLADASVFIAGLANQAGLKVDPAKLANSQTFNSVATQAWAALMQQNGGARGLVKEESERLAQSLPSLVQTPQGRAQIIATLRQAAAQNISDAKQASTEYAQALRADDPSRFTFGLSATQLPQSPSMPAAPGSVTPAGGADWLPPGFKILNVREN